MPVGWHQIALPFANLTPPAPTDSLTLVKEKQNAHTSGLMGSISSVQFSPDGSKIVSGGITDQTIKVRNADSFDLIESRPGDGTAWDGEGVERDGATGRMKQGGAGFTEVEYRPAGGLLGEFRATAPVG